MSLNKRLMEARLGVYEKPPYEPPGATENVDHASALLRAEGGHCQQERMIQAKRKSFDRALYFSYQAAEVSPDENPDVRHRALMNPNALKPDYDDKILSIGYEYDYKPGDIFRWHRKRIDGVEDISYWIIYLQDLTELAYFKGDVRKCNYWVNWKNEKGEYQTTWLAIKGPSETSIDTAVSNNISLDTPNHTLQILMPKNDETLKYFKRYSKFYIRGADAETNNICWRVQATDTISMPGVLEVIAIEYYANEIEDDLNSGIVGDLVVTPTPAPGDSSISGPTAIKPKKSYTYKYTGTEKSSWSYDTSLPIDAKVSGNVITLTWTTSYSEEFTLSFGSSKKEIVVESLF